MSIQSGSSSGSSTWVTNNSARIGVPRSTSMYAMHATRTNAIELRRPSANRMPSGNEITMPACASSSVTIRPPHCLVPTNGSASLASKPRRNTSPPRNSSSQVPSTQRAWPSTV